jgi:excisionase family DNA binding protein
LTLPETALNAVFIRAITSARTMAPNAPVDAVLTYLAASPAGAGMPLSLLTLAIGREGDSSGDMIAIRDALVVLGELVARADPGTADEWVGPAHDLIATFLISRLSPEQFSQVHWGIAQAAISEREDALSSRVLAYIRQNLSDHLWLAGNPGDALAEVPRLDTPADNLALWQIWEERLATLGPDNPDVLEVRANVATWTGQSGDVWGALEQFTALLPDITRGRGSNHPDTFRVRGNLALWTGRTGDLGAALQEFNALLGDQQRVLGSNHPDVLTTRGNIVTWTGESGDARTALKLAKQLLRDQQKILSLDDPRILKTQAQIVMWTGRSDDRVGALELARQLLSDQERVLGLDDTDTLATRSIIVILNAASGNLPEALKDSTALLRDQQRVLGPDHPDVLKTRSNIATWTGQLGDVQEALSATDDLLRDQLRVLGPDHRDTLASRNNHAIWSARSGDVEGAIEAFTKVLEDQVRLLGPDHPDTLDTRGNIALWTGLAGDAPGALKQLRALLRDQERVLGSKHPSTVTTRGNIQRFTTSGKGQLQQGGIGPPKGKTRAPGPTARRARSGGEGTETPLSDVRFLTVSEAAQMMRVSKMTVYRLVHDGELEAIRVGRSFRVPEAAIIHYLREINPVFSSESGTERRT